jgi:hypothetical protein
VRVPGSAGGGRITLGGGRAELLDERREGPPLGGVAERGDGARAAAPVAALERRELDRPDLAAGEIKHITRTAHSEALIVRGAGYDVVQLDQPRASLSPSADTHRTVLSNS